MPTVEYIGYLDAEGRGCIDRVLEDGSRSPLPQAPVFKLGQGPGPHPCFRWGQSTIGGYQVAAALVMDVTGGNDALVRRLSRLVAHYWARTLYPRRSWTIRRTDFEVMVRQLIDCGSWSPMTPPDPIPNIKEPIAPVAQLKKPAPEGWRGLQPKGQPLSYKPPTKPRRHWWIGQIQCRNNHTVSFTILGRFWEPRLDAKSNTVIRRQLTSLGLKCRVCKSTKLHLLMHRSKFATMKEAQYWESLVAENKRLSGLLPYRTLSVFLGAAAEAKSGE